MSLEGSGVVLFRYEDNLVNRSDLICSMSTNSPADGAYITSKVLRSTVNAHDASAQSPTLLWYPIIADSLVSFLPILSAISAAFSSPRAA